MRLLKFYGRTADEALDRVKRQIGDDALIVSTRSLGPDAAVAKLHRGARVEITAAVELEEPTKRHTFGEFVKAQARSIGAAPDDGSKTGAPANGPKENASSGVLENLGEIKSQIASLLEQASPAQPDLRDQEDIADYRYLIDQGVDPAILAKSFRRWLAWRTESPPCEEALPLLFNPDKVLHGKSLREWLWQEWTHQTRRHERLEVSADDRGGLRVEGFIGAGGVGKSTVLAKIASRNRQKIGSRVAVVSLDTQRIGANEQWRRHARLMDVSFMEAVTQEDLDRCVGLWDRFDWIGIDTPGSLTPENEPGQLYGSLLARFPNMRTRIVLDTLNRDQANREQIDKMSRLRPDNLIFSKVDQASQRGAMINLTFEDPWSIDLLSTGRRVPEDLVEASPDAVWKWVFEADQVTVQTTTLSQGAA